MSDRDQSMCRGCREDYYNHRGGDLGPCWSLKSAKVVRRWRIGWWTSPVIPRAFVEVKTYHCHNEPGQFGFYEKLPDHAVEPVRMKKAQKESVDAR